MNKTQIADLLDEIGTLLELRGENVFKCRAFHNASRIVGALTKDIADLVGTGELYEVKGIGKGIGENITEMIRTGASTYYKELKASVPPGLLAMMKIPGLGPRRIRILHERLGIKSIDELQTAAQKKKLSKLEGFGTKSEENILRGIGQLQKQSDKHLYSVSKATADEILATLRSRKEVLRCDIAGSLRRRKEIIGDIDILVASKPKDAPAIMEAFTSHPEVEEIIARGETKSSVRLKEGISCDLRVISKEEYPFALAYFTGSKEHNVELRSIARKFGLSLNEYGFSKLGDEEKRGEIKRAIKAKTEEDIYAALKLPLIPPELRENAGEYEAAAQNKLPHLVEEADLKGTFHCHTTESDGQNTLEEMAGAAAKLGWEYLGIADHSKIAAYARGLTEERVKAQWKQIDQFNEHSKKFRIFKGTEVDILTDGSLDWGDKLLAGFDYVVASIHSKFSMTESEATKRIIRAIKNRYVTMLGHPTGRLLLQREGYPVNMIDVINAAADYGTMIEINAHPMRLDLDWRLCKYAKEKGVMISINPDAHNIDGLRDVYYGIGVARKGWLERKDILNTRALKQVTDLLK